MAKEYKLAIQIAGMVDASLQQSTALTKKQLKEIAKEAANSQYSTQAAYDKSWKTMGQGIDTAWSGMKTTILTTAEAMAAVGAVAGTVGVLATKAGVEWESSFAGVRKTVNATAEELDNLEDGLRYLSKNKPQTASELAEIAEAAGQLGIKTENIEDFTNTIADLKETTNLGDEAASSFAKFANITEMPQEKFDRLGSTIVELGNNTATTEADIMAMSMRIAGAGHQVNMSEADILGFAASLSSVGIEADAGGSSISKLMVNMQLATEKGGKSLKQFASVAGMSADEFKTSFQTDAAGAMVAFITGLNDTERNGRSAIAVLDDMGISEVRLRDTLLRAANAGDLFGNSLTIANDAFEANTALANEAEQRYATFESRLSMVQNRINDTGISLYEGFSDPLSDCLGVVLELTDEMALFDDDSIQKWSKSFSASIPTVVRNAKSAAKFIGEMTDTVLDFGEWVIDNSDVVVGGIAAIVGTIATLKIEKTVMDTVHAMSALKEAVKLATVATSFTPVIAGIALLTGAVIGIATQAKIAKDKMIKQNLAAHFGDITLSLEELEKVARQIVDTGSFEAIETALSELDKVSDIADDIARSQRELDKVNWKISTGFELTPEENESYAEQVDSYIKSTLELAEQKRYAMHLNVSLLAGNDETGQKLVSSVDLFYQGIQKDLSAIGTQLGEAVTTAMEDGIIDFDEQKVIAEKQQQMAALSEKIATSNFEAKLDTMKITAGGGELTLESFQNLAAQIKEAVETETSGLSESLTASLSSLNLMYSYGELSEEDYKNDKSRVVEEYQRQINEIQDKEAEFLLNTIRERFGPELETYLQNLDANLPIATQNTLQALNAGEFAPWQDAALPRSLGVNNVDSITRESIEELWPILEPSSERMLALRNQYIDAGKEVPLGLSEGLKDLGALGILAGDTEAMYAAIGETVAGDENLKVGVDAAKAAGYEVPEAVALGIREKVSNIEPAVDAIYNHTKDYVQEKYSEPIKTSANVQVELNTTYVGGGTSTSATTNKSNAPKTKHAEGGIFSTPHIALFAEAGPEAVVPLDGGSSNAVSIWQRAGEMLGVLGTGSSSSSSGSVSGGSAGSEAGGTQIVYNPIYQISGNADETTLRKITAEDYERFVTFLQRYEKDQRRLAF